MFIVLINKVFHLIKYRKQEYINKNLLYSIISHFHYFFFFIYLLLLFRNLKSRFFIFLKDKQVFFKCKSNIPSPIWLYDYKIISKSKNKKVLKYSLLYMILLKQFKTIKKYTSIIDNLTKGLIECNQILSTTFISFI